MGALNDDAFRFYGQQGFTGSLPDKEKAWLRSMGFENWYEFLKALGFSGSVPDMKYAWLRGKGYTGSLNDVLKQYFNQEISLILNFLDNTFSSKMQEFSLTSKVTFTRASTKTYFGSDGLLKTAAINEWPLEYDPVTLAPIGRSVWESRTNLLTYSEQFDNAAWVKSNATITPNAVVAPDGTLTADKLVETVTTSTHLVAVSPTVAANTLYAASIFLKAGERSKVIVRYGKNGTPFTRIGVQVDLAAGTAISANVGSPTSITQQQIIDVGGGWYKVCVAGVFDVASTDGRFQIDILNDTGAGSYTGDGTSGIYIWGAQLEAGSVATSYIPTLAATVTRAADVAVMTGTNFSDWYNQSEGTFVVSFHPTQSGNSPVIVDVSDGSPNNRISVALQTGALLQSFINIGNVSQGTTNSPNAASLGQTNTAAYTYAENNTAQSLNGGGVATDTAALIPVVNQLRVGQRTVTSVQMFNGHIRSIAYYPKRLSNAELVSLSS